MGNEMGNSNVSGLKEEEKSAVEVPERSFENADDHEDGDVKGENCMVHENFVALSPDDPSKANDSDVEKMVSNDGFSHGPNDPSGAANSHVEKKLASSNEEQDGSEEVPTEDMASDPSDNETPIESNLEGTSGHDQIQTQLSFGREQDGKEVVPTYEIESDLCSKEQEDIELKTSTEYKEDMTESSNGETNESSVIQIVASSELSNDHEKPIDSSLERTSDHQIQKQLSFARDQKSDDQNEVVDIQDEQMAKDLSVTPRESELNGLDAKNLSLCVISVSNDREAERQIHDLSQEDNFLWADNNKEKGEILCVFEDGNDTKEVISTFSIGLEDKDENKDYLVNSSQQVVESQEKIMTHGENKEDLCCFDKIMFAELKSEEEFVASQSEILTTESDSNQENATDFNQIVVDKEEKEDELETLATELNVETQIIPGKLRKSPSFDFDIPFEARCEESDQTPLLHHALAKSRSSSNTNVEESVEEKTIRVERSDSDKPRTPFLRLLQKEEEANTILVTPQAQEEESHVSIITSSKGSGRRKTRASLFSTCICCATTIH